jgi:acetoin utilization protein AcuB
MLVKNWMSAGLISVDPENSMAHANRLLSTHHIHRLPVITRRGRLVGIVSDRDLKRAGASDATTLSVHELAHLLSKVKVSDIMTADPWTITADDTIENAAQMMLSNSVSGLPVTDDLGKVVAVITQNDIFRALIMLTGAQQGGVQIALNLPDQPGVIKQVHDIIRHYEGRIVSILTSCNQVPNGRRKVYFRIKGLDQEQVADVKRRVSQLGKLLYVRSEMDDACRKADMLNEAIMSGMLL